MTFRSQYLRCILLALTLVIAGNGAFCKPGGRFVPAPANYTMCASGQVTVPTEHGLALQVKINGQGPQQALFDTGGVNQISAALARKLGLKTDSAAMQFGAIGGSQAVHTVRIDRLAIGELILRDQTFYVMDIPSGIDAPGLIVGWELMNQFAIRVDADRNQITFFKERTFHYKGAGTSIPLITHENATGAEIRAKVDGEPGVFLFDTGNQKGLFLNSGFVRKHQLVSKLHAHFRGYNGRGFGGLAPEAWIARLPVLGIGNIDIPAPIVRLQTLPDGPWKNDGNIGESILGRFNLTIDCIHRVVYFEKRANWNQREVFNRAGLILDVDHGQETVMTVLPDGPGAVSGLRTGDRIKLINGTTPAVDPHDAAFYQLAGTVLHLRIDREGVVKDVSLTLRDTV